MIVRFKDKHGEVRELNWDAAIAACQKIIDCAGGAKVIDYGTTEDGLKATVEAHLGYLGMVAPEIDRMARALALVRNPIVAAGRVQLPAVDRPVTGGVKVFAAAYAPSDAIVLFFAGDGVRDAIKLHGTAIGDLFDDDLQLESDGLWMFEGTLEFEHSNGVPDCAHFTGSWRRPTDIEAIAAACGENPCLRPCGADAS